MKVRGRGIKNPFGICTAAVYNKQGETRDEMIQCTVHYDLSRYPLRILRPYAKEKKIPNYDTLKKADLLKELNKLQQSKKNKYLKKKINKFFGYIHLPSILAFRSIDTKLQENYPFLEIIIM